MCPLTDGWIMVMWYVYTMETYSAVKKNQSMKFSVKCLELEKDESGNPDTEGQTLHVLDHIACWL